MLCADDFGFEPEKKKYQNFALATTAMIFENNTRGARLQSTVYATSVFEVVYKLFFLCLTNV